MNLDYLWWSLILIIISDSESASVFHLSNLLFLTLCEKTLSEKNYFPLWSFVQVNQRFHTTLASTILSQGGLYSTAVLLAKVRGAGLDVFMALVKAVKQEIGEKEERDLNCYTKLL